MPDENVEEPRWAYWVKQDAWTLREAILLLESKDPHITRKEYSGYFREIEASIIRSKNATTFETIADSVIVPFYPQRQAKRPCNPFTSAHRRNEPTLETIPETKQLANIRPLDFLDWAMSKEYVIPSELMQMYPQSCNQKNTEFSDAEVRKIEILLLSLKGKSHKDIATAVNFYSAREWSNNLNSQISRDLNDAKELFIAGRAAVKLKTQAK